MFQRIISRPGLASGLFVNTRRLGAIASGAIISLASQTALGYGGVFAACAALTVLALIAIGVVARMTIPKPVFVSAASDRRCWLTDGSSQSAFQGMVEKRDRNDL